MTGLKEELHGLDVRVLIKYSVPEADEDKALAVYERFRNNPAAVRLLQCYYADLPEAREEMAVELKLAAEKLGSMLAVLQTPARAYLYLLADDQAVFLQDFSEAVTDASILSYFEFSSADDFRRKTGRDPARLPSLAGDASEAAVTCVACGVKAGDCHMLGCPVEPCPWCESQLSRCNCRFDQLGVTSIDDDDQLDRFEELLEAKGRIPFRKEQNPSYPIAGDDPPPYQTGNK